MTIQKMKVEIWTDIMCPYCYIGKIHYEKAMAQFEHADEVELIIKAFQLSPDLPDKGNGYPVVDYLVNKAGFSREQISQMFENIKIMADNVGVKFNLYHSIAANTLDAHRLIKLAATKGIESAVMNRISKAYFEDAMDYSDPELLLRIGIESGLDECEIREMLDSNIYKIDVENDTMEANDLGIDTVPTFLFERTRSIIGSESTEIFLDTLKKSYSDWKLSRNDECEMTVRKGKACTIDGVCEI